MQIETERLILREFRENDWPAVLDYWKVLPRIRGDQAVSGTSSVSSQSRLSCSTRNATMAVALSRRQRMP